jgi:beta-lactamase class A
MNLHELRTRIEAEILLSGMTLGLFVEDMADGERLELNAEHSFPLASVIKVPIVAHCLRAVGAGMLDLSEIIEMDLSDPAFSQEDGSGVLTYLTSRIALNLRDLIALSLIESDNLATNVLIQRVGMDAINQSLGDWGMRQTQLTHLIEDFPKLRQPGNNAGTARDLGTLYRAIWYGEIPHHTLLIELLCKQKYTSRLPYFLPDLDDLKVGHKTGTLNTLTHDSGLVMCSRFNYSICALVQHDSTSANAALLIARVSELVYRYMERKHTG